MTLKLQISVLITLNAGIDHKKNAVSIYTQWIKTAFIFNNIIQSIILLISSVLGGISAPSDTSVTEGALTCIISPPPPSKKLNITENASRLQ